MKKCDAVDEGTSTLNYNITRFRVFLLAYFLNLQITHDPFRCFKN